MTGQLSKTITKSRTTGANIMKALILEDVHRYTDLSQLPQAFSRDATRDDFIKGVLIFA
jgi:hypothetical protein